MKLIFFNLRDDEKASVEAWKKANPEITLDAFSEPLTDSNKEKVKGYDGIVISQVLSIPDNVYDYINECGIKVFSTRSAGHDMYNKELLKKYGIKLTNVPSYSPNAIGEYVLTATLQLTRNVKQIEKNVQVHDFRWQPPLIGKELRFSRVGVIGTGRIGRAAAKLFHGVGAEVVGFDVYQSDEAKEYLTYVSMEELIKTSDVITIHMNATAENHHMINTETIKQMKDTAVIINAARGSIVDAQAVLDAVNNGTLKGAALDTYEFEGPYVAKDVRDQKIDDSLLLELIKNEKIIYTPHTAFYTFTAIDNLVVGGIESCVTTLKTGTCPNEVKL